MDSESNHWRKPLTIDQRECLVKEFQKLLTMSRGGFLTSNQRMRLLSLKQAAEGEDEKKLWFDIRNSASAAFLDLRLICRVASNNQLQAMFEPAKGANHSQYGDIVPSLPTEPRRNELTLLAAYLFSEMDLYLWKYKTALGLIRESAAYLGTHPKFSTELHRRLIKDVIDVAKNI